MKEVAPRSRLGQPVYCALVSLHWCFVIRGRRQPRCLSCKKTTRGHNMRVHGTPVRSPALSPADLGIPEPYFFRYILDPHNPRAVCRFWGLGLRVGPAVGLGHVSRARGCLPSVGDLVESPNMQILLCGQEQGLRDRGLRRRCRTSAKRTQESRPQALILPSQSPALSYRPFQASRFPDPSSLRPSPWNPPPSVRQDSKPGIPFSLSRCLDPQAPPSVWAPSLLLAKSLGSSHLHSGRGKGHGRDTVVGDATAGEMPAGLGSRHLGPRDGGPWGTVAPS